MGNRPINIGVETPFKLSDQLPIATTGRATDIHREKSKTKMGGPSDQGMDYMPPFVVPFVLEILELLTQLCTKLHNFSRSSLLYICNITVLLT